ncbi:hypothetical protein DFS34DRAFT_459936 [Phlyctochytrium arcticum]|nr:hypothetical protein DFS34DRAFT_459936 [Phlyctochytrium arcticum]
MVFNARFWVPDAAGKRRMLKLLVHMCHKAVTMDRVRRHGITLISNLDGLDRRNQAVELHRWLMELLEFVLPVHLQRVLICNAPWWAQVFPYAWRPGACPSGQLKADIQICKNLTDFMDISQIPRDLGGELVYKHKEWIADQVRIEHAAEESIMVDVDLDTNDSPTSACAAPTPVLSRSSSTTYIFNPGMLLGSPHSTSGKSYFSDKQERDPLPRQHIDEEVAMLDMSEAFGSLPSDIDLPGDTDTQDALVSVNSEVHLTKVH